ncbi:hypothetical protein CTEN210_02855 [Chaetoceros tenuissimus]|uniref:Leucine-rich repeat domain-containing protein n=1 Tax=Chaetoceros tenuissimus TaxID=426638 RepID=A0AAD3H128_9STRA|nr:hypothetical protein CTEN210_02855 [Chaetoceros tenuissimus]
MRVAMVDGLVTLFYDGSKKLHNDNFYEEWFEKWECDECNPNYPHGDNWEDWPLSDECKQYLRERESWQQVIVVEGVIEIPAYTFRRCKNIKRVIMANTVVKIERCAFSCCSSLFFIKLSITIEVIEDGAFLGCDLASVFISPRCREIGVAAFRDNYDLDIFHVHPNVQLGRRLLSKTKLMKDSPFELDRWGNYEEMEEVYEWIKNINNDGKYSLHRACCSFQPLKEVLMSIIKAKGIGSFAVKNEAGITPSRYLKENPYADIEEMDIVRDYIATMMGECNN